LSAEVDQHQQSEKGIRYSVQRAERDKKQRRQISDDRHGDVGRVARKLDAVVVVLK